MGSGTATARRARWRWPVMAAGAGAAVLGAMPLVPARAGADETLYMGGFHEGTVRGGCDNCTWTYFNESMAFNNGGDFGEMSFSDVSGIVQAGYAGASQPSSMAVMFANTFNGVNVSVSTGGVGVAPSSSRLEIDSGNVSKTSTVQRSWEGWSSASWAYTSVNAVATVQVALDNGALGGEEAACDSMDDSWLNADDWTNYPGAC